MPAKKTPSKKARKPSKSKMKKITARRSAARRVDKKKPQKRRVVTNTDATNLKSSYEIWLDAQVAKKSKSSVGNDTISSRASVMPADTFSSWLSKQPVAVKEEKPAQNGAIGTFESWIQKRVEERRLAPEDEASGTTREQEIAGSVAEKENVS